MPCATKYMTLQLLPIDRTMLSSRTHMLSCISATQVLLFQTNFLEEPGFENFGARSAIWRTGGTNHHLNHLNHLNHHVRPGPTAPQSLASYFAASHRGACSPQ